ncbi:MAG TPA: hypothetical protein VNN79_19130, partial [Actinomycetota bacterium]|nr:hypothetical protein [Actinomycetota bacterium]
HVRRWRSFPDLVEESKPDPRPGRQISPNGAATEAAAGMASPAVVDVPGDASAELPATTVASTGIGTKATLDPTPPSVAPIQQGQRGEQVVVP